MFYTAPAEDFAGPEADFFAEAPKTVHSEILSNVMRPLIRINPVEGTGPPKSQDPWQLPLLPCPIAGAGSIHYKV